MFIPLFLKINISEFSWNLIKKNWVEIRIMNGNNSNKVEGRFKKVKIIGKNISVSPFLLKNFISSKIFKIKIREVKINVIKINLEKKIEMICLI